MKTMLVVFTLLAACAAPSAAQQVTWTFSGQAQLTAAGLGSTPFTGSLTWDLSTPGTCPSACFYPLAGGTLVVNGTTYYAVVSGDDGSALSIVNDAPGDAVHVAFMFPNYPSNLDPYHSVKFFVSGPATMFSGTVLPADTAFVSQISEARLEFDSYDFEDDIGYLTIGGVTLQTLIGLVQTLNLEQGIANSLDAKLQNALHAYQAARAGNVVAACGMLNAFLNEVNAQSDGALTTAQAAQLIAVAEQIRAGLRCR